MNVKQKGLPNVDYMQQLFNPITGHHARVDYETQNDDKILTTWRSGGKKRRKETGRKKQRGNERNEGGREEGGKRSSCCILSFFAPSKMKLGKSCVLTGSCSSAGEKQRELIGFSMSGRGGKAFFSKLPALLSPLLHRQYKLSRQDTWLLKRVNSCEKYFKKILCRD